MRRPDDSATLCCPLTRKEQAVVAELMRQSGHGNGANLVRLALVKLADWYHVDVPADALVPRRLTTVRSRVSVKAGLSPKLKGLAS